MKNNSGITVIALIIIIAIMLILATISVVALSGDNSLINKAGEAKEDAAIKNEKDIINLAVTTVMNNDEFGELVADELADELNTNYSDKLTATVKSNKKVQVAFNTGRNYLVNADGNVTEKKPVQIPEGLKIGSDVTYEPEGGTYNWQAEYCSSSYISGIDDVTLDSRSGGSYRNTSWKVFKIDEEEGEIQLVPSSAIGSVHLGNAQGYNNAVQLLDEACSSLYSDTAKEITAESIDMDDIEPLLDETKLQAAKDQYNHKNTSSYSHLDENDQAKTPYTSSNNFPRIYEEEVNSVINGIKNTKGLGQSDPGSKLYRRTEATSLTEQTTATNATEGYFKAKTSIQPYQTYYKTLSLKNSGNYKDSSTSSAYASMLNGTYWVASRSIDVGSDFCHFYVCSVQNGNDDGIGFFNNYMGAVTSSRALFPVVTLSSDLIKAEGSSFKVE